MLCPPCSRREPLNKVTYCSRRLGLGLNTVKRYIRAATPARVQRVPSYRDHLRGRRKQELECGGTMLLAEIHALGFTGSHNLLMQCLDQRRHLPEDPHLSPRRVARLLLPPVKPSRNGSTNDTRRWPRPAQRWRR